MGSLPMIVKPFRKHQDRLTTFFRYHTLVITFVAYACLLASQKPFSVYKILMLDTCLSNSTTDKGKCTADCCGYSPFNGKHGKAMLGLLDALFIGPYAIGLLVTSDIMERLHPRYCISVGCFFTSFFTCVVGLSFAWGIHDYMFYVSTVVMNGMAQSTAWPVVLSSASNWLEQDQRKGLIFRLWNLHVYFGVLIGFLIAGRLVETNLSLSFFVPALIVAIVGLMLFFSLVAHPHDLATQPEEYVRSSQSQQEVPTWFQAKNALEFRVALKLPGVIEFALGLFFARMVSYTFSAWLPYYIHKGAGLDASTSAYFSTFFTVGAMVGGVLANYLHDLTNCSALISAASMLLSIPVLYFRDQHLVSTRTVSVLFEIVCGMLVLGPYTLINTAVAAELGSNRYIMRDNRAFPKVAAIIECTGSMGAAVGPALTGVMLGESWSEIIHVMMALELIAALCLTRGVVNDLRFATKRKVDRWQPDPTL